VPNKTALLADPSIPRTPPCRSCGGPTEVIRIEPAGERGRFRRSFQCMTCETEFIVTDESDAEIEELAGRMARTRLAF
jgi:hypothetical protein